MKCLNHSLKVWFIVSAFAYHKKNSSYKNVIFSVKLGSAKEGGLGMREHLALVPGLTDHSYHVYFWPLLTELGHLCAFVSVTKVGNSSTWWTVPFYQ